MTWNQKYWDALDQLYWTPKYLGLSSIPQRKWKREDGLICVPEELVNKSGPTQGREANWVPTSPGPDYFIYFRAYGPTAPMFDKTWQLNDIEKVSGE